MNRTKSNKHYVICLLDLKDNRNQKGLIFAALDRSIEDLALKLSSFKALTSRMGTRWELHITEIKNYCGNDDNHVKNFAQLAQSLLVMLKNKEHDNERLVIVPGNRGINE